MTFLGSWETIPRASVPSITTMTAFKARLNGEISNIQRMRPLQTMTASGAPKKRHSYKSPCCIKQDAEEGLKHLAEPSISIINEPRDEAIPADISCRKYFLRTQNDICAQGQFFLTNKRILEIPAVSYMYDDKSHLFNLLKIASLTGIFSLQEYHTALASTDIMTVVQSGSWLGDLGDISTGFTSAFLLIFFSELGDKTFFIAALLASRKSSAPVFLGTFGALAVMTIISVFLGRTFHYADDILQFRVGDMELPLDDLAAVGLLVYFGVSTLLEAGSSDKSKTNDEQEEAELAIAGLSGGGAGILAAANTVISTFALVFVAEWGDKSFFSTIALAAASSPLGVVGGAVAGHGVATLIAVLGGSLLGTYISEKVITYTGGVLFLVFAAVTLFEIFI